MSRPHPDRAGDGQDEDEKLPLARAERMERRFANEADELERQNKGLREALKRVLDERKQRIVVSSGAIEQARAALLPTQKDSGDG